MGYRLRIWQELTRSQSIKFRWFGCLPVATRIFPHMEAAFLCPPTCAQSSTYTHITPDDSMPVHSAENLKVYPCPDEPKGLRRSATLYSTAMHL